MIEKLRQKYILKTTQTVVIDKQGYIIESDNLLFSLNTNTKIQEVHLFFEVGFLDSLKKHNTIQTFYGVHIATDTIKGSFDIYLNSGDKNQLPFVIFYDLTQRYNSFQKIAQEKNTSVLSFRQEEIKNQILKTQKEFKDKFLTTVSHDLRTPIASMLGFLEILEQTELNKQQKDLLKTIQNTNLYLNGLVEDLVDISKIESGQFNFDNKPFDFYEFINQIEKVYLLKTVVKNLELVLNIDQSLPKIIISDRIKLFQLITNLMDNAVKFTEKGDIKLSITENYRRADNVGIQFVVADTGIGIKTKDQTKIFDSFAKFHQQEIQGLGIGLSIVKEIVDQMNGTIKMQSKYNLGTTIEIHLPLKIDFLLSSKKKRVLRKSFFANDFNKKLKVLVVDDNETNQLLLLKLLSDHGGFFIDITNTAKQALELIEIEKYNLVLLDMAMPEMTGLECVKIIRENPNSKIAKIPVVILSANLSEDKQILFKEIGVKNYLRRPHTRQELFTEIYSALKR